MACNYSNVGKVFYEMGLSRVNQVAADISHYAESSQAKGLTLKYHCHLLMVKLDRAAARPGFKLIALTELLN